jgi:hypothetical protein
MPLLAAALALVVALEEVVALEVDGSVFVIGSVTTVPLFGLTGVGAEEVVGASAILVELDPVPGAASSSSSSLRGIRSASL